MNKEKIKLDKYEELHPRGKPWGVEKALEEAAERTFEKRKRIRLTVELPSPELRDEAIRVLKDRFGEKLKIVK